MSELSSTKPTVAGPGPLEEIGFDGQPDDPSPDEIRQACLRIQATWTEEERRYRAGLRDGWWPLFST
ncbi:MAG: hypothetical protein AB7F89_08555 [Pirellulaceae bacterium]